MQPNETTKERKIPERRKEASEKWPRREKEKSNAKAEINNKSLERTFLRIRVSGLSSSNVQAAQKSWEKLENIFPVSRISFGVEFSIFLFIDRGTNASPQSKHDSIFGFIWIESGAKFFENLIVIELKALGAPFQRLIVNF